MLRQYQQGELYKRANGSQLIRDRISSGRHEGKGGKKKHNKEKDEK